MPTAAKTALVAEIKDKITGSKGMIMADYRGLSVKEMQELRSRLRGIGSEIRIYKNRLTEIALRELAMPSMDEFLEGPTAFVFTWEDPVGPAKTLMDFAKEHQALEVKGGFIDKAVISADSVKALAALPSREELIAKLMGSMLNPVRGFMAMANAPAAALARAMRAVADQKAVA